MVLFDWVSKTQWLADVPKYASPLLTSKTVRKLRKERPECWSDNFDWLQPQDADSLFAELFYDHYTHIRCFHGARPIDVGSYLTDGILGQSSSTIEVTFRKVFADLPKESLDMALDEFLDRKNNEQGKLWVLLEEKELVQNCGHYLIQGSEYVMALAASLCRIHRGEDYRLRLRDIGTPTIFEAHVPIDCFADNQVISLTRSVLSGWGQFVSGNDLGFDSCPCLVLYRDIEPEQIAAHSHPARIRDPHFGFSQYNNPKVKCDHCV